jgi:hypothetical protein
MSGPEEYEVGKYTRLFMLHVESDHVLETVIEARVASKRKDKINWVRVSALSNGTTGSGFDFLL